MITAEYLMIGKYGELKSVTGKGRLISFSLGAGVSGRLTLGGKETKVVDGRCTVDVRGLTRGEYKPRLVSEGGTVELEALVISGERVSAAKTSEAIHRYALERIYTLETKNKKLEERISELETLIKGTALFS